MFSKRTNNVFCGGGYNVPPFCGITGIFDDYYGMATVHKSQNHNILTYHNDS